jgi:murein L,D-transpeptidase YafK
MGIEFDHARVTRRALLGGAATAVAAAAVPALAEDGASFRLSGAEVPVDLVVIVKRIRRLHLLYRDRVLRSCRVALGRDPLGHKQERGDGRTPEGLYRIDYKKPASRFNLALHIDYPNERDRARAAARGADPGGAIYIHGQPVAAGELAYFRLKFAREDWTDGCVAVTNAEMDVIYRSVRAGTPVLIRP